MLSAEVWAEAVFGSVQLGDARRTRRAVRIGATMAAQSEKTLPQAMGGWAELKAVYRLLSDPCVTHAALTAPHGEATRRQCCEPGEYVLVADTTQLDFTTHRSVKGLGRIGNDGGQGLIVHTTVALRLGAVGNNSVVAPRLLGLWDQQVWTRRAGARRGRESKTERLSRARESQCWGRALADTEGPPPGVRWTFVADREADIYELLSERLAPGTDLVIRACQARALEDQSGVSIFDAIAHVEPLGEMSVDLRSRPGQAARQARLQLRATRVRLRAPWRPDRKLQAVEIGLVQALEEHPPRGAAPLNWVLLTTLRAENFDQAHAVVQRYALRWLVEEYHKALKSGTRIEDAQLSTVERLEALLGLLAIVAVRLLDAKLLARSEPDRKADPRLCTEPVRHVLEAAFGPPKGGWTNREFIRAVARLGGFLARRHDGQPGWQTIWRGWNVLTQRVKGFLIADAHSTYG